MTTPKTVVDGMSALKAKLDEQNNKVNEVGAQGSVLAGGVSAPKQINNLEFKATDYPLHVNEDGKVIAPAEMVIQIATHFDDEGNPVEFTPLCMKQRVDPTSRAYNGPKLSSDTANFYHEIIQQMQSDGVKEVKFQFTGELVIRLSDAAPVAKKGVKAKFF